MPAAAGFFFEALGGRPLANSAARPSTRASSEDLDRPTLSSRKLKVGKPSESWEASSPSVSSLACIFALLGGDAAALLGGDGDGDGDGCATLEAWMMSLACVKSTSHFDLCASASSILFQLSSACMPTDIFPAWFIITMHLSVRSPAASDIDTCFGLASGH